MKNMYRMEIYNDSFPNHRDPSDWPFEAGL